MNTPESQEVILRIFVMLSLTCGALAGFAGSLALSASAGQENVMNGVVPSTQEEQTENVSTGHPIDELDMIAAEQKARNQDLTSGGWETGPIEVINGNGDAAETKNSTEPATEPECVCTCQ
jgi:hypothetical protein